MSTLGIGIIGAGKHGVRYARHLVDEVPGAVLVAICRRSRAEGEALAATYKCAFHDDWRELIADPRVDAIVTVVPPVLNPAIAEAACLARKPILLEKPVAVSVAEGRRLAAMVAAAGVPAMVAHTMRFDATANVVKAHLPRIGALHSVGLTQRFEPTPLDWLDRRAESGGGITLHTGVHSMDLLRVLTGHEVIDVSCVMSRIRTRETEDNFVMLGRMDADGLLAHIAGSRALGGRTGLMEFAGADGQIVADHVHRFAWMVRSTERTTLPVPDPVPTVREVLRAFVAGVRDRTPMPITVEDGIRAVAIAEACYRSDAAGGAPVRVSPGASA
jgi:predicted dehydrogenase